MYKFFLVTMTMLLLVSSTAFGQEDPLVRARETYTRLHRAAPLACHAPQCTTVSGRTRVTPRNLEQYQEANRFLVAGARACLVDCTCNVQGATTPSYCSTEQAAAPAAAAAAPQTTPAAPAPAPAASTPPVAATPPLPPYMPQGMFQGWSYAQLGYCPSTFETTRLASTVGIFDATWYSPGSRRTIDPSLASGGTLQATSPVAITEDVRPSMYRLVITVNGRKALLLRNGRPQMAVQQMQGGGHCVRSALPAHTDTSFVMELEGNSPTVEIGVYLYLPTASGALGALMPVSRSRVRRYQVADLINQRSQLTISSTDGGMNTDI